MQQEATGDRNQVIGQVLGGIVINQLTIQERVPAAVVPPTVAAAPPLTQQEYRQRQVLLSKVKDSWIKGVLKTSLHARAMIELGLHARPDLVQHPFQDVAEFPNIAAQALPDGTSATTTFDQMRQGRTLLILGEPGSGKTITLLKLAQDLLARTEADLRQPIPVVLNLSSWARKTQTIAQWLVQELLEKYQVSKALGTNWVETEALILLLDGLDEVKAEQRNACVQALNKFMQTHGTTELIICCRIQDYQALADRLLLRSAICIQPLTSDQIDQYFEQAGEQLESLKEVLRQDKELQGLATSPLMLSIMSLAYQGSNQKDIIQGGKTEDYRQRLFDTYINRMFQRRGTTQQYSRQKTQHWLIWLAQGMTAATQTVFLIERLQPSWLPEREQRIRYRLESALINGFILGLIGVFVGGLIGRLTYAILLGLSSGLVYGLISLFLEDIRTVENLRWTWKQAQRTARAGLVGGLAVGLVAGLVGGLTSGLFTGLGYWLKSGLILVFLLELTATLIAVLFLVLVTALIGCLIGTVVGGVVGGFRGSEIPEKFEPNQGIWASARIALTTGLSVGLIIGLISGLFYGLVGVLFTEIPTWDALLAIVLIFQLAYTLLIGAPVGLVTGLILGGTTCLRHLVLRLLLCRNGYSPWNYAHFLDCSVDRLFLQKVGGGYIFVHRMLLEHFAAMSLEQEKHQDA